MPVVMAVLAAALAGTAIMLFGRRSVPGARSGARRRSPGTALRGRWLRRHREPGNQGVAEAQVRFTRQLAALLRSGSSIDEALATLETVWSGTEPPTPASVDITTACRLSRAARTLGSSPRTGLTAHARSTESSAAYWWRLTWCLALSERSGAALATLLEHVADELEAAADRERALDVALAGPRSTRRMLGWLPVAGLGMAQLAGANPAGVLLMHPAGRLALLAGAVLWAINAFWGARLLASARAAEPAP